MLRVCRVQFHSYIFSVVNTGVLSIPAARGALDWEARRHLILEHSLLSRPLILSISSVRKFLNLIDFARFSHI